MSAMWRWHALEETEHKAVAFDVYRAVEGNDLRAEAIRYAGQVLASVILFSKLADMYLRALRADPETKPFGSLRGWRQLGGFLLGRSPGVFRRAFREYLDYFRPGLPSVGPRQPRLPEGNRRLCGAAGSAAQSGLSRP